MLAAAGDIDDEGFRSRLPGVAQQGQAQVVGRPEAAVLGYPFDEGVGLDGALVSPRAQQVASVG